MGTIWQVSAGDGARYYGDIFLKYGLMLAGPGHLGPYKKHSEGYSRWGFLKDFHQGIEPGDLVALKRPKGKTWEVVAVGIARTDEYLEVFEDIEGWDQRHTRRVEWRRPVGGEPVVVEGLRRGTLCRVHHDGAKEDIQNIWKTGTPCQFEQIPMVITHILGDEAFVSLLQGVGMRLGVAETVVSTVRDIGQLTKWYIDREEGISEHEIRTFVVVPLLLALGWSPRQIRIEWNRVDIALFDRPYGPDAKMVALVETKRPSEGLRDGRSQAVGYVQDVREWTQKKPAERPGVDCQQVIVTNGYSYQQLRRPADGWPDPKMDGDPEVAAMTNLLYLRERHPLDPHVGAAPEVFKALMPPVGNVR